VLIGENFVEGNFLVFGTVPFDNCTEEEYNTVISEFFTPFNLVDAVHSFYPDAPSELGGYFQAWSQIMGDWYINGGTYLTGLALSKQNVNVYKYLFSHVFTNSSLGFLGATHSMELYFLFGAYEGMSRAEIELGEQMTRYWTNFATTGNPNGNGDEGLSIWPLYEPDQQNNTMVLDIPFSTTTNFDEKYAAQWSYVLAGWENDSEL